MTYRIELYTEDFHGYYEVEANSKEEAIKTFIRLASNREIDISDFDVMVWSAEEFSDLKAHKQSMEEIKIPKNQEFKRIV